MSENKYDAIRLKNQLCFPLYAASREVIKLYRPYLDKLDLTYTQYITLMVLWENGDSNVKDLGKKLYLDSGTLTPLLKGLEKKGYVTRFRTPNDERYLTVSLTKKGESIKDEVVYIQKEMAKNVCLTNEETVQLYKLMYKLLSVCEHKY